METPLDATTALRQAATDACNQKGLKYLWHGIIIDQKSDSGVRYDVIGLKSPANGGGRQRFSLPNELAEKITASLGDALTMSAATSATSVMEDEAAALPEPKVTTLRSYSPGG